MFLQPLSPFFQQSEAVEDRHWLLFLQSGQSSEVHGHGQTTAVLPAPEPTMPPRGTREPPPVPKDDTETGLQEAIDERDLEKLRRWLSEVLLQGRDDESN